MKTYKQRKGSGIDQKKKERIIFESLKKQSHVCILEYVERRYAGAEQAETKIS